MKFENQSNPKVPKDKDKLIKLGNFADYSPKRIKRPYNFPTANF